MFFIEVGNFVYTRGKDNEWIYKSKSELSPFRSKKNKESHKDPIQYRSLEDNERAMIEDYSKTLKNTVLEITKNLINISNESDS